MHNKLQNDRITPGWHTQLIFIFIILMMGSLFVSRAALSATMMGFVAASFLHGNIRKHLGNFFTTPLLWALSLLFFIPFISGLWSEDLQTWTKVVRVKLPLFVLPLAFAGCWQLTSDQWKWLIRIFFLIVTAATLWSAAQYFVDSAAIHEAYLRAKTIPVPLEGDYIRFSWLVCVAVIIAMMLWEKVGDIKLKTILLILVGWYIVYLHILAARTGLFACYLFLLAYVIYRLLLIKRKTVSLGMLIAVLVLPVLAWFFLPTFQNRFKYLRYDFDYVVNSSYLVGATDGNRLFSIKAGWNIVKENPLGVGAGDLRQVTNDWYKREVPAMVEMDKIYPSNEWLIYGGFAGWPGLILFTVIMALPFFIKGLQQKFFWFCFHGAAIFSFIVDTGLEVQFGIFLYGFITCCWWKWLRQT